MKHFILALFLMLGSSCAALKTVQDAFTTTYKAGQFSGRQQVLDEMEKNRGELQEVAKLLGQTLIDFSVDEKIDIVGSMPVAVVTAQLITNQKKLEEILKEFPPAESTE